MISPDGRFDIPPRWTQDLKACYDLAMTLLNYNGSGYFIYLVELGKIAGQYAPDARPTQRCEAILKTIGKWKS